MSFLDVIAPGWALKRERQKVALIFARRAAERARSYEPPKRKRSHEGASSGRRLAGWKAIDGGPAGMNPFSLDVLRRRSRDLRENNPYFARAVAGIASNVVGYGIQARLDGTPTAEEKWRAWAETTACDADGRHDLYGLQALVMAAVVESGEVFIRLRKRESKDDLPVPIQLQVIEADYLDTTQYKTDTANGTTIEYGIERDARGRPVAYHFYTEHPASPFGRKLSTIRVPADEVCHVFRVERPGQTRGVPWVAPAIARLRQLDDYEDAALERARVAACYAAFVHDLPDITPPPVDAEPEPPDEDSEDDSVAANYQRIEPGAIEYLPPGKDIKFGAPPPISDFQPFTEAHLRAIACGIGVPYELLTGDLSKTSFASARIGWLEFNRHIEAWRWTMLIPQLCNRIFTWFGAALSIAEGEAASAGLKAAWSPPHREMISPAEEIKALRERVRAGFVSWGGAIRELGYDPDEQLEEIAEWNAKADELGVILETDARKVGGPSGYTSFEAKAPTTEGASDEDPSA
jgi:lambda family phage portal protein